jgi:hypothetical protein
VLRVRKERQEEDTAKGLWLGGYPGGGDMQLRGAEMWKCTVVRRKGVMAGEEAEKIQSFTFRDSSRGYVGLLAQKR